MNTSTLCDDFLAQEREYALDPAEHLDDDYLLHILCDNNEVRDQLFSAMQSPEAYAAFTLEHAHMSTLPVWQVALFVQQYPEFIPYQSILTHSFDIPESSPDDSLDALEHDVAYVIGSLKIDMQIDTCDNNMVTLHITSEGNTYEFFLSSQEAYIVYHSSVTVTEMHRRLLDTLFAHSLFLKLDEDQKHHYIEHMSVYGLFALLQTGQTDSIFSDNDAIQVVMTARTLEANFSGYH